MNKTVKQKTWVIAAGGTGGHVMPAIEVAKLLEQQGYAIIWLGSKHGMESSRIPQLGWTYLAMPVQSFGLRLRWKSVQGLWRLFCSVLIALRTLWHAQQPTVIGFGGYVSLPAGLAALILRKPLVIHEQNAVLGRANRCLSAWAQLRLCAYPGVFPKTQNATCIGNPVRPSFFKLPALPKVADRPLRVLVLGGSQGSAAINDCLPEVFHYCALSERPEIRHQTGVAGLQSTQERYAQYGVEATCQAWIEAMDQALGWADVVIARAGAMSCAECAAAQRPMVLIPLPHAMDDHQTLNAAYWQAQQAAQLVQEKTLLSSAGKQQLGDQLVDWAQHREVLITMGQRAQALSQPDITLWLDLLGR